MTVQQQVRDRVEQLESLANKEGFDFVWSEVMANIVQTFERLGMREKEAIDAVVRMARHAGLPIPYSPTGNW